MGSPIVIAVDSGHFTHGVWAPKGERPLALGHHRYEWHYVYGFDEPATGLWKRPTRPDSECARKLAKNRR